MTSSPGNLQPAKAKPKFAVGDRVIYTNGQGVVFHGKRVVEVERREGRGWFYYIEPTDTPWMAFYEAELCLDLSPLPPDHW